MEEIDTIAIINQYFQNTGVVNESKFAFNWLGIIAIIISTTGCTLAVIAFIERKKSRKINNEILLAAEKSLITKDVEENLLNAQSSLSDEEENLKRLQDKINFLTNTIENEIPKSARIVHLKDRIEESTILMKSYFDEIKKAKNELYKLNESVNLDEKLMKAIEKEIHPKHIINEQIANVQIWLTILAGIGGLCLILLPNIIGSFIFLSTLPLGIRLTYFVLLKEFYDSKVVIKILTYGFLSILGISLLIIGILGSYLFMENGINELQIFLNPISYIVTFLLGGWLFYFSSKKIYTLNKMNSATNKG